MARIALRVYNREIEHLIEGGQIEEAIAHCRHIFKYFPKHINTYRLLGKAYLETQRYGDAADILQRVLSSIPDDFISHLGMSIIREDEGNLDEAIWHMERAFEVQPANRAIQDELRRLYGRRDGLEPPKIRLTRGALARMYAKGELYPQAIAELRAALAEDPQRLDLQVVLADVYARAGQRVEAASMCNGLLRKLPYCLVANEVMADILADSERSEDARVYRQRAQALNAYLAHISPGATSPDKVPDNAVSLERLVWQPGKSIEGASQPDWAASLGVELESSASQKEEIPDWLSAVQTESDQAVLPSGSETGTPFTDDSEAGGDWMEELDGTEVTEWPQDSPSDAAQPSTEEEIPEWMKVAGWSPATGETEEEPVEFDLGEEDYTPSQAEKELEDASLPDWLKEIVPESQDQDPSTGFDDAGWDQGLSEDAAILESTPDWFKESEGDESESEESPDWLADLAGEASAGAPEEATAESDEDLPEWLQEIEAEASPGKEEQIPDWLKAAEPVSELDALPGIEAPEGVSTEEEIPDWLKEAETEDAISLTGDAEAEPIDEAPDWLKELEAETGETLISEPEAEIEPEPAEELPDWLLEVEADEKRSPAIEDEGVETVEVEAEPADEFPDWLKDMEAQPSETIISEPQAKIDSAPAEELPDWLEVTQLEEIEPATSRVEEAIPAEEMPDWLIDMAAEEETDAVGEALVEAAAESDVDRERGMEIEAEDLSDEGITMIVPAQETLEEEPDFDKPGILTQDEELEPEDQEVSHVIGQEEVPQEVTSQLGEMDSEAAFAWLESLAAKQGADEEGLLLSPEERTETPPDWVKSTIETESESSKELEAITEPADGTSELVEIKAEQEPVADTGGQEILEQAETLPDWLQEIEDTASEEDLTGEEPLPDWLQEAGEAYQEEHAELDEEAQAAEEIPEWVKSMQLEEEGTQPEAEEAEELPDWLQETPEEVADAPAAETQEDWLAELEEPIIEGDTKPTRPALESQEEQITAPEPSPTPVVQSSEVEEQLPLSEALTQAPELAEQPEQAASDETFTDADAGFAWLESLAAKQGADEGMLLAPEERLENPPEWIQTALDRQFGEETRETLDEIVEAEVEEEAVEEEEVIIDVEQPTFEEAAETPEQAAEAPELPDWLIDMEAEAETDETAEVIDALVEATEAAGEEEIPELPTWLEESEEKEESAWTPPEPVIQKLDLNQASLAEIERLPGIGFIMAQKIVTYREQNGPFSDFTELQQVPGFNQAVLSEIEELIMVETVDEEPLSLPMEADAPPELVEARQMTLAGTLDDALEKYSELILQKKSLEDVIYDLNQILLHHEENASVWQALGDAQMRSNLVQDALESYMQAERLFR